MKRLLITLLLVSGVCYSADKPKESEILSADQLISIIKKHPDKKLIVDRIRNDCELIGEHDWVPGCSIGMGCAVIHGGPMVHCKRCKLTQYADWK